MRTEERGGQPPDRLMSALETIAATARDGAGHRAAARALVLAADLTADDRLRARRLRRAAVDAHLSGDEPLARELLARADDKELDEDDTDPRLHASYAYAAAGHTGIARVAVSCSLSELRARGSVRHLPAALAVAAFVELQEGRLDAALRLGGEGLLLSGLVQDDVAGQRARHVLATVEAIRSGTALSDADVLEAHVRTGWRPSEEKIAELMRRARAATDPLPAAVAARSVALVVGEDRYAEWFEAALRHHAGIRCPFELGRTRLAYGERLRRSGLRVRARAQLLAALDIFGGLAAAPWSARAEAELSATAAEPGRDAGHGLTPQESHVARAVATGQTNREVAAALFLSSKTVEFHLGNIYRKLGVRNRTQLAQRYRRAS
ncbi:helix-turn-helix transcriptional regulator [Paractinoplanes atraurantiacus]|uniref:Regulatory protein, luxR family n=1 Tax=Paractinoplanes atraurantiacus TaxID=1036182 RepID=A0A285HTQ6_9ACTN|nr:helix-turn-helix transcriptional regulator [Actinoplanes atraurantiacus]SNY39075.1 regulatory protein, luxR family [Actinoplanes atraurantiacus]